MLVSSLAPLWWPFIPGWMLPPLRFSSRTPMANWKPRVKPSVSARNAGLSTSHSFRWTCCQVPRPPLTVKLPMSCLALLTCARLWWWWLGLGLEEGPLLLRAEMAGKEGEEAASGLEAG